MNSIIVFLGSYAGKSKSGNNFAMVTLGEVSADGESRVKQHFTDGKLSNIDDFNFGDYVKPEWVEGKFLGDPPRLSALALVKPSPYFKKEDNE